MLLISTYLLFLLGNLIRLGRAFQPSTTTNHLGFMIFQVLVVLRNVFEESVRFHFNFLFYDTVWLGSNEILKIQHFFLRSLIFFYKDLIALRTESNRNILDHQSIQISSSEAFFEINLLHITTLVLSWV